MGEPANVDDYIYCFADDVQVALEVVRLRLHTAVPTVALALAL